jgi:hypothetical protein
MTRGTFQWLVAAAAVLVATAALSRPFFDPRAEKREALDSDPVFAATPRDPACHVAQLVSTGGLAPRDPHTLAVRRAGYSNFELAYGGKIILLDAYFDRGSNYSPLGFKARDVTRADVILIGHGHFDHMSDAASVGIRTGATIVGAPVTTDKLAAQDVPAAQIRTVTGRGGAAKVRRLLGGTHSGAPRAAGPASHDRHGRCACGAQRRAGRRPGSGGTGDPGTWRVRSAGDHGGHDRVSDHAR